MSQILLDIPEDSLLALRVSAQEMGEELRLAAAVKLFEVGRLSSGAAAELAGFPKPLFLVRLGDYGVPRSARPRTSCGETSRMPEAHSSGLSRQN
jgi:predicted HTH domain antitoxin